MSSIRSFEGIEPQLGQNVYVDASAVVIGKVVLADQVSIWPQVVLRGDINHIHVGARTNIQDGTIVHVTHQGEYSATGFPTIIGDDVTVGHQAMLHGCTIGHRVLIGMQAILLDGCVVHDDVMIGAGSLVPPGKQLESGYLYVGSPAKRVRELTAKEKSYLTYSAEYYAALAQRHQTTS